MSGNSHQRLSDKVAKLIGRAERTFSESVDIGATRPILREAELECQSLPPEWQWSHLLDIVRLWMLLGDLEGARSSADAYLNSPEEGYKDLCYRAEVKNFLGDKKACHELMNRAEKLMFSSFSWRDCSAAWQVLGETEEAKRCMRAAEVAD